RKTSLIMSLTIKHLKLDYVLLCAPIAGVSNISFRQLACKHGASLVFSEMISTRPLLIRNKATSRLVRFEPVEKPIIMQIVTGRPWEAYESTMKAIELGYDGVDLNCGCPARKILRSKAGAFLMKNVEYASKTLRAMRKAVDESGRSFVLSAKIRTSFTKNSKEGFHLSKIVEDEGFDMLTVHARTRDQHHKGEADFAAIAEIKKILKIPVIFNGGIKSAMDAKQALEKTGTDGVMVGQGALGNPWLFAEIAEFMKTGKITKIQVSNQELKTTMLWHFDKLMEQFEEVIATLMFRRFASWYVRDFEGASVYRKKYQAIRSREDFINLTDEVFSSQS
ncbi:MAG: tRNA-dihydrouridine synthase family protein, partial [Candidatus Heimdallarchaeota archaeon]|nr:tRNA-dihydrouridine synthase family protein [Candidatus Heimdallarchaeota archaeon]